MPGKWDGRSRIPTKQYKDNYDSIFKKKKRRTQNEHTRGTIRTRIRDSNKRNS